MIAKSKAPWISPVDENASTCFSAPGRAGPIAAFKADSEGSTRVTSISPGSFSRPSRWRRPIPPTPTPNNPLHGTTTRLCRWPLPLQRLAIVHPFTLGNNCLRAKSLMQVSCDDRPVIPGLNLLHRRVGGKYEQLLQWNGTASALQPQQLLESLGTPKLGPRHLLLLLILNMVPVQ